MSGFSATSKAILKHILILLAVSITLALYVVAFIGGIFRYFDVIFMPHQIIRYYINYGIPAGAVMIITVIIFAALLYVYYERRTRMATADKLHRKMILTHGAYGEADFEEPSQYRKNALIQSADDAYGAILGMLDGNPDMIANFRMDSKNRLNRHIAIVGASGAGKTTTVAIPMIFQYVKRRESVFITDPDGGIYQKSAQYFKDHGYVVRRLDLNNPDISDGWDILASIKNSENKGVATTIFATAVVNNTVDNPDNIYANGPKELLIALILEVISNDEYRDKDKNIKKVMSILSSGTGLIGLETVFGDRSEMNDGMILARAHYNAFKNSSPALLGNIITNLASGLGTLLDSTIAGLLSTDEIDFIRPANQPCAYYCVFPDSNDTYKLLVSIFFSMLFTVLVQYADSTKEKRCPVPVNFLLDEFPSIGRIPSFDKKMATIRKRNMNVTMIFQNLSQLQNVYETTWETLLSNCSTFMILSVNDMVTAEYVSRRSGETAIRVGTNTFGKGEGGWFSGPSSQSYGEGKRNLLSVDEVFKMPENDSIIIFQGHNPILLNKYFYTNHPEAKYLKEIYTEDIPYRETEAHQIMIEENEEFSCNYLAEHPITAATYKYSEISTPPAQITFKDELKELAADILKLIVVTKEDYKAAASESTPATAADKLEWRVEKEDTEVWKENCSDERVMDEYIKDMSFSMSGIKDEIPDFFADDDIDYMFGDFSDYAKCRDKLGNEYEMLQGGYSLDASKENIPDDKKIRRIPTIDENAASAFVKQTKNTKNGKSASALK